jgi:hypothetical protein
LSRRFGVGWVRRADGHGREVTGVSRELMAEFSSRRQSITELTRRLAVEFQAQHGHAPDARALGKLRQWANHASRRAKDGEPLDLAAEAGRWADQARASEAGALEPVLPAVSARRGPGAEPPAKPLPVWELTFDQERDLMGQAVARVQEAQPAWRKADLIRFVGELLPDDVACVNDQAAAGLLERLADRVLAGGTGQEVVALEAPEWPRVPESLRRADGRSIYRPHSGTRYATLAQLTMEEQFAAQAQQRGAPRLAPEMAALLLGADQAQLEAQLQQAAHGADRAQEETGSGLRLDQAAAAFLALTSDRRAEILVGPAGSGKTRTAAQVARLWRQAGMGDVYALTTSQAARNILHDAGVELADNTAVFLGHLAGQREARGAKTVRPGTLLLLDEASMMSMADMAAIMRQAAERDCRVLITGDHEQLAAVEGGGGMMMLLRRMGYVQLPEPVRFTHEWERDATLRLRMGDTTVLLQYEEQGRLRGGDTEQAMDLACRAWTADHLAGKDTLLLARTEQQARELSRRIRDDLIRYRVVWTGPEIRLRNGAVASPGDLIVARQNRRQISAGTPGQWLTNRDVLRVIAPIGPEVVVRRLIGRDPVTAQAVWTPPFAVPRTYLFSHCDLAYATTPHAAQGRTVDTAHVLVDGLGDRQGLYVAMSRGREANYAYCVTGFPRHADVREGSRPAPELERARRLAREREGLERAGIPPASDEQLPHRDPVAVLADVMRRDGAVLSATETLRHELAAADHLGVLGSIWYDLARRAQVIRFERALREVLPEAEADTALSDAARTWLWRSLRDAEAAGLDGCKMLRLAVGSRPLADARDAARVIDARVRRMIEYAVPRARQSWAECVPEMGDPDLNRFMAEVAVAMDGRVRRTGEHLAVTRPRWVTQVLGDVPAEAVKRAEWERRAAQLGAYRELYGYDAVDDAIGPEPGRTSPEARADWHTAFAALGKVEGIDLRGCTDGQLRLRRAMYERETSWAPRHVGEELRLARLQARTAWENNILAVRRAATAGDSGAAERHRALAGMWQAMHDKATRIASMLAAAQGTRRQWEALTEPTRRAAVAADLELRRRRPGIRLAPLRSAEPGLAAGDEVQGSVSPQRQVWVQGTLDGTGHLPDAADGADGMKPAELFSRGREVSGQLALALRPEDASQPIPDELLRIGDDARRVQEEIDKLRTIPEYEEDDDASYLGPGWASLGRRDRDAILQPPRPELIPAKAVLEQAQAYGRSGDREPEAG